MGYLRQSACRGAEDEIMDRVGFPNKVSVREVASSQLPTGGSKSIAVVVFISNLDISPCIATCVSTSNFVPVGWAAD